MRSFPKRSLAVLTAAFAAVSLAACSGGSSGTGTTAGKYVNGGTFTLAEAQDPGTLDPQASAVGALIQLNAFA
jgi:ABC-type oligopeptide transport system substrate-binding subunit